MGGGRCTALDPVRSVPKDLDDKKMEKQRDVVFCPLRAAHDCQRDTHHQERSPQSQTRAVLVTTSYYGKQETDIVCD